MHLDAGGISLSSMGLMKHFQFCFTFLLIIECCSCFLFICNMLVSLVLLYSPQQSRYCSHAPTWCLLEITFSGFPMLFPKDWGTFPSLLFLSYRMCFPHIFSKYTTKTVQRATQQQPLSSRSWSCYGNTRIAGKEFSGNSWLLTCSLGHTTWSCYHDALSPISLGQKVNYNSLFLSTDHRSILNKFSFLLFLKYDNFIWRLLPNLVQKNALEWRIQNTLFKWIKIFTAVMLHPLCLKAAVNHWMLTLFFCPSWTTPWSKLHSLNMYRGTTKRPPLFSVN